MKILAYNILISLILRFYILGQVRFLQKKSKKNLFTIVGSTVLIGSLILTTTLSSFAFGDETDDQLNALNQQQQNLQQQLESTKNELQNTTIEKNEQLKQLNQINNNIESVQKTVDIFRLGKVAVNYGNNG